MRKLLLGSLILFFFTVSTSFAYWQIANPFHGTQQARFVRAPGSQTDHPGIYTNGSRYLIQLNKGLLKPTVFKNAEKYGWQVKWNAPNNYYVLLKTKIVGSSFSFVMGQLISHYPLRATFNSKIKTMTVFPARYAK